MRVLGVDFGERRVGVAVSDQTGMIAGSRCIIPRHSNQQVAQDLAALVQEVDAGAVVLGMPLDSEGQEGYQARRVRRFAAILEELLEVPLILWDESLSTVDAKRALRESGARKKRRSGPVDDVAAAILLQSYLDRRESEVG